MEPLIVKGLSKRLSNKEVLKDVNMRVKNGSVVALLGPNGAGKSTLMKIVVGIYKPTRGNVKVFGKEPLQARRLVGYSPQEGGFREELSGIENLSFIAGLYGLKWKEVKERANEILERLGVSLPLKEQVKKYSGGMKKILSLVSSMIHDPKLLILDEPTVALDPSVRRRFWQLMNDMKKRVSILFATHYVSEAERFADYVYILYNGKIIAEGTPEELKRKYAPKGAIEIETFEIEDKAVFELCKHFPCKVNGNTIRILSEEPDEDVPKVISKMYEMGGRIKSLKVLKPSLEDAFLKVMREWG